MKSLFPNERSTASKSFWRAVTAQALGTLRREDPIKIAEKTWKRDEAVALITRATSAVANTTTVGWGAELAAISVGNVLHTLAPASAASRLQQKCVAVDFVNVNQVLIPKVTTLPTATWTAEGNPSAIVQPVYGSVLIGPPRKLLFGAACSVELQNYAIDVATEIIRRTLIEAAAVALDTALLDAVAADATRPAGLLNGVADLGATSGGSGQPLYALVTDLGKMASAMATAKINSENAVLIMNPAEAIRARALLVGPAFANYEIIGTLAVPAGSIVGIAPDAVAMYVAAPQIEISTDGLVHMESTTPLDITTAAVATSVKTAWQTGLLLLKVRLRCTWAPLASAAVQKVTSVTW
jgi:hypothetical protein